MKYLMAGPCALEKETAFSTAAFLKGLGANVFRAGCWKGQNRPMPKGKQEYLGMGEEGVALLAKIQKELLMPCATDMQSVRQANILKDYNIAYPQVGARNMDSLEFLRQVRKIFKDTDKKIILKRGPSSTVDEWIGAAEHLGGPERVILCERGTVHFDRHDYTRYRLDFVGVAEVKIFHPEYEIIVDPSHGSGSRALVPLLAKAALVLSDGLMIEVHPNPDLSPTDAPQIIGFMTFKNLMDNL